MMVCLRWVTLESGQPRKADKSPTAILGSLVWREFKVAMAVVIGAVSFGRRIANVRFDCPRVN
jgi:hypothetical protein